MQKPRVQIFDLMDGFVALGTIVDEVIAAYNADGIVQVTPESDIPEQLGRLDTVSLQLIFARVR